MDHRGDFNDIIGPKDKQEGRRRIESSFLPFRSFIRGIEMEEVSFKGIRWIWTNNRMEEGFIKERLDMFFGSTDWMLDFEKAEVKHILTQYSNHSMFLLDTNPHQPKMKSRFIF